MTEQLNVRTNAIEEFYDVGEQIGSGQFAVVKKLHSKSCGNTFAAKFMKKRRSKALKRGTSQEQFLREADVLRSIEHKGVIYLHDIFETKGEFVLVLELLSGGELFEFLSEQEFLTEDEAVGFLKQVIEAIEYLHKKRIVHLDIKPENIVLKEEKSSQIKLIDFGLARKLSQGEMVREIMGTPEFVAPEIIAFEAVGTETDMWAIGVLTYIMLSGASPFLGDDVNETFSNISMVDYEFDDEYFKDISEPAKDFISTLLVKDKSERMSAEECLQHEWMQDLDDQESPNTSEDDDICDSFIPQTPIKQKNSLKKRRSTMIKTDAFKAFTARARWQKSLNKVIAISRLALLGKKNSPIQRQTSSDDSTKPVANIETNQDDNNDGKDNKTDDFAKLEEKLKNIEVKSDREEEKATSDSIVKEQLVTEKETLVEDLNSSDSSFGVLKKTTDEKNRLNSSENGREILMTNTTCVSKDEAKTLPETKKADEQVKPDILVKTNTEGSLPTVTRTEENSNRFESLTGSKIASENGKASRTVPEIGERRASGESSRHRQQLENANEHHVRRRGSKEEGKHQQEIAVNTTNEGTGKKHLEDTAWLRKQKPFYLNKDRKEASKVKKGFTSTKAEILKWEKKSSSESTTERLLTSRGNVKKEEQRLSLPGIPKTELKKPQDSRHERHSIGVVREPERERRVYTTTMRIAPEKEDIDSKRNLITNLNTSRQLKDETIGEVTRHHDQDIKTTIDTGTDCANNTKRSSLTRIQGSTVHKQDDAAIIDKEHTFVIRTSLHSQDDSDSDVESEVDKEEDNTAKEQNGTTHSGKKVSLAFVNYEPGKKEMEAFPQLSLTLQKSPTSPDAKEDDFVWVVTTEKNKRRDFLTRVLAPKVKAAKNSQFEGDVFEKRRIRHKPIGEKGPPKVRTRSSSSPSVSSSVPEVRIKHHSVATAPMMTHDGKNVPTVQLSSDMPALSFKIQMGEIKLADP